MQLSSVLLCQRREGQGARASQDADFDYVVAELTDVPLEKQAERTGLNPSGTEDTFPRMV